MCVCVLSVDFKKVSQCLCVCVGSYGPWRRCFISISTYCSVLQAYLYMYMWLFILIKHMGVTFTVSVCVCSLYMCGDVCVYSLDNKMLHMHYYSYVC